MFVRLSVCRLSVPHLVPFRVSLLSLALLFRLLPVLCLEPLLPCGTTPRQLTTAPPPTEESCPLAEFTPLTGYEPKLFDDFHLSGDY